MFIKTHYYIMCHPTRVKILIANGLGAICTSVSLIRGLQHKQTRSVTDVNGIANG